MWSRYLSLSSIDNNPEMIQVEIFELESHSFPGECRPIGNNPNTNNSLDIMVGAETMRMYGIKIVNKTEQNLYPHIFYFDNSDFSIGKLILRLSCSLITFEPSFRMFLFPSSNVKSLQARLTLEL